MWAHNGHELLYILNFVLYQFQLRVYCPCSGILCILILSWSLNLCKLLVAVVCGGFALIVFSVGILQIIRIEWTVVCAYFWIAVRAANVFSVFVCVCSSLRMYSYFTPCKLAIQTYTYTVIHDWVVILTIHTVFLYPLSLPSLSFPPSLPLSL